VAIGRDLLDLPFAEVVRNLAFSIAEGQLALDRSSIETLRFLLENTAPIVPEIAEIIEPVERQVDVGPPGAGQTVTITGARIRATGAEPITLNLLQSGLLPTFYQFTEAEIDVKLSISMKRTESQEAEGSRLGLRASPYEALAFASPVDYRTASTYSYSAEGASVLRATMRPVPPPPRLIPSTVTINTFTSPPTVTTTE
jgi:hypothetical protein